MVLKNLDNKTRAYSTLGLFFIVALIFWYISDNFSLWASTANPWLVMFSSILLNPIYLLLVYWLFKEYKIRGLISGLLISLASDIVSLSHSILKDGILPSSGSPLYSYADTLFYKIFAPLIGANGITIFILYVLFSTFLVYIAFRIIRRTASFNKIVKEAI